MPAAIVALPVKVAFPVTPNVPPREVAPLPTLKVLDPVTEVLPFKLIAPVPVEKVPEPLWEILLLLLTVIFPAVVKFPFSSTVTVLLPLCWISSEVFVAELVSLRISDGAVP